MLILSIIIGIILLATGNVALFLRLKSRMQDHYDKQVSRYRGRKRGSKVSEPQYSEDSQVSDATAPQNSEESQVSDATALQNSGDNQVSDATATQNSEENQVSDATAPQGTEASQAREDDIQNHR